MDIAPIGSPNADPLLPHISLWPAWFCQASTFYMVSQIQFVCFSIFGFAAFDFQNFQFSFPNSRLFKVQLLFRISNVGCTILRLLNFNYSKFRHFYSRILVFGFRFHILNSLFKLPFLRCLFKFHFFKLPFKVTCLSYLYKLPF